MKDLVSIIVPVYKVEKYLHRCVDSIINQTYKNIEVILIDDSSPDRCPEICDEYAKKDERVKVIHKQNGGVSSARNAGLDAARGEFICFVDSDDWISESMIDELLIQMKHTTSQLVMGGCNFVTKKGTISKSYDREVFTEREISGNILKIYDYSYGSVWAKLFLKEIIDKESIRFKISVPLGEDTQFLFEYIKHCSTVLYSDAILYYYDRTISGSAVSKFRVSFSEYWQAIYDCAIDIVKKSAGTKEEISKISAFFCCYCINYYLTNTFINEEMKNILKNSLDYYQNHFTITGFRQLERKIFREDEFMLLMDNDLDGFIKLWRSNFIKNKPVRYMKINVKLLLRKFNLI